MLVLVLVDLVAGSNGGVFVDLVDLVEILLSTGDVLALAVVDWVEVLLGDGVVFPGDLRDSFSAGWKDGSTSGMMSALGGVMQNSSPVALRNFLFLRYL